MAQVVAAARCGNGDARTAADEDEQPVITYERKRFSIGEAISYYEFVLELAVALEV